eukprot:GHVL01006970.1.p1 GENE.GHVL01006970.1~~GHVL01006970.1.p1  ORF type:complete len:207 (+),score=13.47 GHVL01006970.1:215-835(+)
MCFGIMCIIEIMFILAGDVHVNPGPVKEKFKKLSIIHLNVRSLRNKLYILEVQVQDFDIVTLSETRLSNIVNNDDLYLSGFNLPIRQDRPNNPHGGVAVYVKDNLYCKTRNDLSIPDLEAIWIETKIQQESLLVGTFYRPPSANVGYWDLIDQSVNAAGMTGMKYIVCGDFNSDVLNSTCFNLQDIMIKNGLFQLVKQPTRITEDE